jgi:hexulose-6-phosphate isomerase
MPTTVDRREFLAGASAAAIAAGTQDPNAAHASERRADIKKAVVFGMLPRDMPLDDRFKLARDSGFDGVEAYTTPDPKQVDALRAAAEKSGLRIHSIMNQAHWQFPLSSDDAQTVKRSLDGMVTSLHNAHDLGADTVLLVPAVVNPKTRYIDAYRRSQRRIRELLPQAEELGVTIAVEEVWNKFLLSPLEFARYVDEFNNPHLVAYFDVGNVVLFGYPQDWIRTLGERIKKVHIKDFKVDGSTWHWTNLYDGAVDWPEVRRAFAEIGYSGWFTAELSGGDAAYLTDVAKRMDKIIREE